MPTTLTNPYSKPNPLSKPLYSAIPKPTTTTVGNVSVNTTKPVIFTTPKGPEPITGDVVESKQEEKLGFWQSKSKTQKTLIIVSVVATLSLMTYIALKKK
jgi:hypothetical protein